MISSVEHLFHFRCDSCNHAWTVADKLESTIVYCPQCGHKNEIEEIESYLNQEYKIPTNLEVMTHPYKVYVLASRPAVEKINGGVFFIDVDTAKKLEDGPYKVYEALLSINTKEIK